MTRWRAGILDQQAAGSRIIGQLPVGVGVRVVHKRRFPIRNAGSGKTAAQRKML